jgi:hypothetical protein
MWPFSKRRKATRSQEWKIEYLWNECYRPVIQTYVNAGEDRDTCIQEALRHLSSCLAAYEKKDSLLTWIEVQRWYTDQQLPNGE